MGEHAAGRDLSGDLRCRDRRQGPRRAGLQHPERCRYGRHHQRTTRHPGDLGRDGAQGSRFWLQVFT